MKLFTRMALLAAALAAALVAQAQTYPTTNPTYIPTAPLAPTTFTTTGDYVYAVSGISTVTLRVSGTCTSLVAAPQGTNDGTNWTTIQAIPVAGGANITSITGTGFWRVNTAGFTKTRLHITTLAASCTVAAAGSQSPGALYLQNPNTTVNPTAITDQTGANYLAVDASGIASVKSTLTQTPIAAATATATNGILIGGQYDSTQKTLTNGQQAGVSLSARGAVMVSTGADAFNVVATQGAAVGDPCQNPTLLKSSAVVNQSSSATTKVVDTSASTVIYVCNFTASLVGTNPTVTVKTGTHVTTDCDTSAATLSGAINPSATAGMIALHTSGTLFKSIAGGQICLTTAATTSVQGILTYVQQ